MTSHHSTLPPSETRPASVFSYTCGFLLSVILTLGAFWIAPAFGALAPIFIVTTALLQLLVQLVFFLHLGRDRGPQWNLGIFMLTAIIIGILVGGTLWIMANLARLHAHAPTNTDLYHNGVVAPQNELR